MDNIIDPILEVQPPEYRTDRHESKQNPDFLDLYDDDNAILVQNLRKKYSDDQIMELLKKLEND